MSRVGRKSIISNKTVCFFIALIAILTASFCLAFTSNNIRDTFAAESQPPEKTETVSQPAGIPLQAYVLGDNTGYYADESKKVTDTSHPFLKNFIDLAVVAKGENTVAAVDTGSVLGANAYGITGKSVSIQLKYNFDKTANIAGRYESGQNRNFSLSSDTYQSIGEFKNIGVIGEGALLVQKSYDGKDWKWQSKDGETKTNLGTFDFTKTVKPSEYNDGTGRTYTLYTPAGEDLSSGVYIKLTFAYEVFWTEVKTEKKKTTETNHYYNIIEQATFYLVQNSGEVLFHNASNFDKVGEDGGSGAITVNSFETLKSGDGTLNGFRLDTLGVTAYDITYKHNGVECGRAADGQFFLHSGRYDFTVNRKVSSPKYYTIFIDRREVNDAVVGYFGQGLFTADSQRIYTTGEYPTYIAGRATWNLNATDGTVLPLTGKLFKTVGEGDEAEEIFVKDIAQTFSTDRINPNYYKTAVLQGTLDEVGFYKAEFWGNPRYDDGQEVSGDLYHFIFRFEIVSADTPKDPSINQAYLKGLGGFSDFSSKYYAVALPTRGIGNAVFAFADYSGAYDFVYNIEREKVAVSDGEYTYKGVKYTNQKAVLTAVDEAAQALISLRYFDALNPESYQTADIADEDVLSVNFDRDIIVFLNDDEQEYMKSGLPSLNGRKYRYVSPETGGIEEGRLDFAFVFVDGFESQTVTLSRKDGEEVFDILYGVSVEYQLGLAGAPSGIYIVRETNVFGDYSEYETVYIKPGDMAGSAKFAIFRNGVTTEKVITKADLSTIYAHGFILKSLENEYDPESIVKITRNGQTQIFVFHEAKDLWFSQGGAYQFQLQDRQGNSFSFSVVIDVPAGVAEIYLELEFEDAAITKQIRAFVGQQIDLPTPAIGNELYVFDGWLYDDALITNGKFTPLIAGDLHIWQQTTQKYTYLNFNSNGGDDVERIVAEIGVPMTLPTTEKDGWAFGGWQYGGNIYNGVYTPATASPTFAAVWNYVETTITLYDGNIYQTITSHVGDKVLLPFPQRTGYTFFGWKQDGEDGGAKVYYGQITRVPNAVAIRLDALWIRTGAVNIDGLSGGASGRTRVYFVDGTLDPSNMQGYAGDVLDTPNPTRAGFILAGWVWKTTATTGKIYSGGTMTVPENAGGKIMLEAVWTARQTAETQGAIGAGTTVEAVASNKNTESLFKIASLSGGLQAVVFSALIVAAATVLFVFFNRRKGSKSLSFGAFVSEKKDKNLRYRTAESITKTDIKEQSEFSKTVKKLGLISLITAFALIGVLFALSAFGKWDRGILAQALGNGAEQSASAQTLENGQEIKNPFGFDLADYAPIDKPSKAEVLSAFNNVLGTADGQENGLDLSDEEAFLYALIMLDLYGLGYDVFPAKAILPSGGEALGLGYSDYAEAYNSSDEADETVYFGAGFVSLPRQTAITEADIESGIYLIDSALENAESDGENGGIDPLDYGYLLSFTESYGPCHYIADGKYVVYSVDGTNVVYSFNADDVSLYDEEYGAVYSYDDGRNVFDPDLGKAYDFTATSLNTLLDPQLAKGEYERYIAEQTANGFTVDTLNYVYISYAALDAYYLSNQDETLLGIDVEEFYAMERFVGPNTYYTVDENGNLTLLEFPPPPVNENKASWLDRLAGAALAIGTICVGVIIVAAVSVVSCGAATAAAPYIMGAFIGAGIEIFVQTVIQGNRIGDINWLRVGIAAVSGALAAIPGIGWLGAGLLQGTTQAAMTLADGGSLKDALIAFGIGFATGVIIHGVGKALSKIKFCFVAGTAVVMAGGYTKAIENVRVGDMVKSYNQMTGEVENKRVLQTFENTTNELVKVTTSDGQEIIATPGHKFFANNKWVSAENLRAGDILVNVNGQKIVVEAVQHELLENPVKIYNFEVSDNHTYFVGGENGVVVHNADCAGKKYSVYFGDDASKVGGKYVGRTGQGVDVRVAQHAKNGKVLSNVKRLDGLTYDQSRGLEQALIKENGGIAGEILTNLRNGVADSNPNKELFKKLGEALLNVFLK